MASLLEKAIRTTEKGLKKQQKLLFPKGSRFYILKRDGRLKPFTILAIFDTAGVGFHIYRHSETIDFAVQPSAVFETPMGTKSMRNIAAISTHIAHVIEGGESIVYAIQTGDEFQPFYLDFVYKFFVKQVGDPFDPAANQET